MPKACFQHDVPHDPHAIAPSLRDTQSLLNASLHSDEVPGK